MAAYRRSLRRLASSGTLALTPRSAASRRREALRPPLRARWAASTSTARRGVDGGVFFGVVLEGRKRDGGAAGEWLDAGKLRAATSAAVRHRRRVGRVDVRRLPHRDGWQSTDDYSGTDAFLFVNPGGGGDQLPTAALAREAAVYDYDDARPDGAGDALIIGRKGGRFGDGLGGATGEPRERGQPASGFSILGRRTRPGRRRSTSQSSAAGVARRSRRWRCGTRPTSR